MKKYIIMTGLALAICHTALTPAAWADNVAHCEVLLVKNVEDADVDGALQVTDYRPAVDFIASVHDDDPAHQTQIEGHNIQALLCRRMSIRGILYQMRRKAFWRNASQISRRAAYLKPTRQRLQTCRKRKLKNDPHTSN